VCGGLRESDGSELVGGWGKGKQKEEQRKGWEEGQGPMVEQWQPVSDRVEAHQRDRKKEKHWSQRG
jgi:hypothetical protein